MTALLPTVAYFSLMSYNIGRMKPGDDYTLLAISFLLYLGFNVPDYLHNVHRKLPSREKSLRKTLLKFAMWLTSSATMIGVVLLVAPFYSTLAALPLYVVAFGGSALLFYSHMIHDNGEERRETTLPEKHASFEKWNVV